MNYREYFLYEYLLEANTEKRIEFLKNKWENRFDLFDFTRNHRKDEKEYSMHIIRNLVKRVIEDMKIDVDMVKVDAEIREKFEESEYQYTKEIDNRVNNFIKNYVVEKVVNNIDPTQGKYSDWIIKTFLLERKTYDALGTYDAFIRWITEDAESQLKPLLRIYDRYKKEISKIDKQLRVSWHDGDELRSKIIDVNKSTDINIFPTARTFYQYTEKLPEIFEEKITKEEEQEAERQADKIYNSENWLVLIPKTIQAAKVYGKGTRWCTAAREHNMFNYYNQQGPLYIFINKKTQEKYQFHFQSKQFMDAKDSPIEKVSFFLENEELQEILMKIERENTHSHEESFAKVYFLKDIIPASTARTKADMISNIIYLTEVYTNRERMKQELYSFLDINYPNISHAEIEEMMNQIKQLYNW